MATFRFTFSEDFEAETEEEARQQLVDFLAKSAFYGETYEFEVKEITE